MVLDKIKLSVDNVKLARDTIQTHAPKTYEQRVKNISDVHWAEIIGMANKIIDHLNNNDGIDGQQ